MESIRDGMTSNKGHSDDRSQLLGSFSMHFTYGLLIIRDKGSTSTHDQWDATDSDISIESDSIYLAVLNAVDGIVRAEFMIGGRPKADMDCLYSGTLNVPSGQIIAHDPNGDISAVFYIHPGVNKVSVEVDEKGYASAVVVRFGPADQN